MKRQRHRQLRDVCTVSLEAAFEHRLSLLGCLQSVAFPCHLPAQGCGVTHPGALASPSKRSSSPPIESQAISLPYSSFFSPRTLPAVKKLFPPDPWSRGVPCGPSHFRSPGSLTCKAHPSPLPARFLPSFKALPRPCFLRERAQWKSTVTDM